MIRCRRRWNIATSEHEWVASFAPPIQMQSGNCRSQLFYVSGPSWRLTFDYAMELCSRFAPPKPPMWMVILGQWRDRESLRK